MARKPRNFEPGYVFHVTQRGNNKANMFFDREDFQVFLELMQRSKKEYPCLIYAYCLLTNHIHLLIEALKQHNISLFMQYLTGNYVRYINKNIAGPALLLKADSELPWFNPNITFLIA